MHYHIEKLTSYLTEYQVEYDADDRNKKTLAAFLNKKGVIKPEFQVGDIAYVEDRFDTINNCSKIGDGSGSKSIKEISRKVRIKEIVLSDVQGKLLYFFIPCEITDYELTAGKHHYFSRCVYESELFASPDNFKFRKYNGYSKAKIDADLSKDNLTKVTEVIEKTVINISNFLTCPEKAARILFNKGFLASEYSLYNKIYIIDGFNSSQNRSICSDEETFEYKARESFITSVVFNSRFSPPVYSVQPYHTTVEEDGVDGLYWSDYFPEWTLCKTLSEAQDEISKIKMTEGI